MRVKDGVCVGFWVWCGFDPVGFGSWVLIEAYVDSRSGYYRNGKTGNGVKRGDWNKGDGATLDPAGLACPRNCQKCSHYPQVNTRFWKGKSFIQERS